MIWLWIVLGIVGVLVLLAIVLAVIGKRLPKEHVASVTVRLNASRERVWKLVDDIERHTDWAKGVTKVERVAGADGKDAWRQFMGRNSFVLTNTRRDEPARLERTISDDHHMFGGKWVYEFAPDGSGCRVTITEYGEVYPAIPRALMHYVLDPSATMRGHLESLARALNETATIERLK